MRYFNIKRRCNMDTSSITGSSLLLRTQQTQQALSTSMMKQAANQQNMMANLLAQNVQNAPQPAAINGNGYNFSTYA
jgi:hypothetical protein